MDVGRTGKSVAVVAQRHASWVNGDADTTFLSDVLKISTLGNFLCSHSGMYSPMPFPGRLSQPCPVR